MCGFGKFLVGLVKEAHEAVIREGPTVVTALPDRTIPPLALCAASFLLPLEAFALLQLNEIRTNQPGPDDEEFVEIKGAPGTSLDDVWFIYIGDSNGGVSGGSGVIELAIDLSGLTIPGDGHFLMCGPGFEVGTMGIDPSQVDFVFADFGKALENSDNVTALLVRGFTEGEILVFDHQTGTQVIDIDEDNNGVPNESLPWSEIIDAVSLVETPDSGDQYYGSTFGGFDIPPTDGGFVASHAYRSIYSDAWYAGNFVLFEEDEDGNAIGLHPDAKDTPGAVNVNSIGLKTFQAIDSGGGRTAVGSFYSHGSIGSPFETSVGTVGSYGIYLGLIPVLYPSWVLNPELDLDLNGLPDKWERDNFDMIGINPDDDADNDGTTHEMEMLARTDPNDPASVFRPSAYRDGNSLIIPVQTQPDRSYRLWGSPDLSSWSVLDTLLGDGSLTEWSYSLPEESGSPHFLRVEILLP
jgi:hypothetical protein